MVDYSVGFVKNNEYLYSFFTAENEIHAAELCIQKHGKNIKIVEILLF